MTVVAWYEIVVGVAMLGLWTALLATRQVPQIAAGDREIWFHLAAELVTAVLLVAAGIVLVADPTATVLSGVAIGALLYTTIASPGYYAARGEWPPVILFGILAVATLVASAALLVTGGDASPAG